MVISSKITIYCLLFNEVDFFTYLDVWDDRGEEHKAWSSDFQKLSEELRPVKELSESTQSKTRNQKLLSETQTSHKVR